MTSKTRLSVMFAAAMLATFSVMVAKDRGARAETLPQPPTPGAGDVTVTVEYAGILPGGTGTVGIDATTASAVTGYSVRTDLLVFTAPPPGVSAATVSVNGCTPVPQNSTCSFLTGPGPCGGPPETAACVTFQLSGGLPLTGQFQIGTITVGAAANTEGAAPFTPPQATFTDIANNPVMAFPVPGGVTVKQPVAGETVVQCPNGPGAKAETGACPMADGQIEGVGPEGSFFAVGDRIRINPGQPNQEDRTVTAFGSFILDTSLNNAHEPGEKISRIEPPSPTSTVVPFILEPALPTPSPTPTPARTPAAAPSAGGRPDGTSWMWLVLPAAAFSLALAAGGLTVWRRHRHRRRAL